MRVLSWNVQGAVPPYGSKDRIHKQIDYLREEAETPDLVLLNEVNTYQRELWRDLLRDELGYGQLVDTLDWAHEFGESDVPPHQDFRHVNGNLIGVQDDSALRNLQRLSPSIRHGPWEDDELKDWDTNFPEKILNAKVEDRNHTIELWNIRTVPGSMYGEEKIKILENTYNRITKASTGLCILAGDLNAPEEERSDGTVVPWRSDEDGELARRWVRAELNVLEGLEDFGMVDVFRHLNGYGDLEVPDVSFQNKRFDHIIASADLNPQSCYYDHKGFECSDHAPVIAEFSL